MMDILSEIDDLIRQAKVERSHYYTAGVLEKARSEIVALRAIATDLHNGNETAVRLRVAYKLAVEAASKL